MPSLTPCSRACNTTPLFKVTCTEEMPRARGVGTRRGSPGSAFEFRRREERSCHLLGAYCIPGPVLGAFHGPSYTPESSQVTWILLFPFYRRDGEMPQELEN